jgi:hypothetical protein
MQVRQSLVRQSSACRTECNEVGVAEIAGQITIPNHANPIRSEGFLWKGFPWKGFPWKGFPSA